LGGYPVFVPDQLLCHHRSFLKRKVCLMMQPIKSFTKDLLQVQIFESSQEMGQASAEFVEKQLNEAVQQKGAANLILATGASQFSFLHALQEKSIAWNKITVFHLDEYKGISEQHPASFRKYLKERILDFVKPAQVYLINGDAENLEEMLAEYAALLASHPIDVACIGIGENGHIAFNDPPVADFNDPRLIKVVKLDQPCRQQQLGEGWFPTLDDVPKEAVSLTIPAIMSCKTISCVVPDERKAKAVHNTLYGEISTACPASVLRRHPNAVLFLDLPAASQIKNRII
jgi:glucosamine-6-phosphate deaminase